MKIEFSEHKEKLFEIILSENHHDELLSMIRQLYDEGKTKKEIYELFLEFHKEIQIDNRTKQSETAYDILCDFMDGFTAWSKGFKILPNEPDL